MVNRKRVFLGTFYIIEMACEKAALLIRRQALLLRSIPQNIFVSGTVDLLKLEGFIDV